MGTPLTPVGDESFLQYGDDRSTRKNFTAVRVREGVVPEGSVWTKNPVAYSDGNTDRDRGESGSDPEVTRRRRRRKRAGERSEPAERRRRRREGERSEYAEASGHE